MSVPVAYQCSSRPFPSRSGLYWMRNQRYWPSFRRTRHSMVNGTRARAPPAADSAASRRPRMEDELAKRRCPHGLDRETGKVERRLIGVDGVPITIQHHDGWGMASDHATKFLFTPPQLVFRPLAVFDIGVCAVQLDDLSSSSRTGSARQRNHRYSPSNRRRRASTSTGFPKQRAPEKGSSPVACRRVNRDVPTRTVSLRRRETGVVVPAEIEKVLGAVGQPAPGKNGEVVDHSPTFGFRLLELAEVHLGFVPRRHRRPQTAR